jgi:hypothetical protein
MDLAVKGQGRQGTGKRFHHHATHKGCHLGTIEEAKLTDCSKQRCQGCRVQQQAPFWRTQQRGSGNID